MSGAERRERSRKPVNPDPIRTALLVAATFASIMVGVVAARSLLLTAERPASAARTGR